MLASVERRSCIGIHTWLVAIGNMQRCEQPIDLEEVLF
jgi:hypothetical protein